MNSDVLGQSLKRKLERTVYDILQNSIDDNFIKAGTLGSRVTHALSDGVVYNKPVIQGILRTMDPKQWPGFVFDSQLGAKVLRVPSRQLGPFGLRDFDLGTKVGRGSIFPSEVSKPLDELCSFSFFSNPLSKSHDSIVPDFKRSPEASVSDSDVLKPPPLVRSPVEQKRLPAECFVNMGSRLFLSDGKIFKLSNESCDHDEIIHSVGEGNASCADCGIKFSSISLSDFLRTQKRD